ncbi:FGGY-family carbohydrate kinase [Ruminococcus sp. Marseille-P6503]|uniref:xylulokinase n=1 Tax=Ruminococcus sp. Marseille-P6503 TaxID=2364796 RepID=UPI000F52BFD9|nr:FGGY-family carbohydrate kinase [Ruminococcus sp. Marseille-P6503]
MLELDKTYLGIELGSTRIKASLIDQNYIPVASGSHQWENRLENGYWTYSREDIHNGIRSCFASLAQDVMSKYGVPLTTVGAMGISAMMHGYMAFDKNDNLLVPFRTWRNTTTKQAAERLTKLLDFNIPQRWSIAHLYQAALDNEPHIARIAHITTLAGYINYLLTGERAVGIGEASGIFPVEGKGYNKRFIELTEKLLSEHGFKSGLEDILPPVKLAGDKGAVLTAEGAKFLDPSGVFQAGVPLCPPEGDAGTGMTAANAVREKTGNVSAGTSIFSMLVLEKNPGGAVYPEIDIVATPDGLPAAMVHCNNCCCELDEWVEIFSEFGRLAGNRTDRSALYEMLYKNAMTGDPDCGGVTVYNFLSGEPVAGVDNGRPMYFRMPEGKMSLANFFRAQIYSAFASLKIGMDILFEKEQVTAVQFTGHGGLFKVKGTAQQILADAFDTPVSVMETAGEGGAWGMALLAAYMVCGKEKSLADWLDSEVFSAMKKHTVYPESSGKEGFRKYLERYTAALAAEKILGGIR